MKKSVEEGGRKGRGNVRMAGKERKRRRIVKRR